jgi:hypothetical protein
MLKSLLKALVVLINIVSLPTSWFSLVFVNFHLGYQIHLVSTIVLLVVTPVTIRWWEDGDDKNLMWFLYIIFGWILAISISPEPLMWLLGIAPLVVVSVVLFFKFAISIEDCMK